MATNEGKNYHSTLAIVVNDGSLVGAENLKATRENPVFIMVEDNGGARPFKQADLDSKYIEYYRTAINYYNGNRSVGGRTTEGSDKAMEGYIYQLFNR